MRLEVSYATNVGRVRDKNEDALLVEGRVISRVSMEAPELLTIEGKACLLFAVADGMGGMPCGEVASGLALEYLRNRCPRSKDEVEELLRRAKEYLDRYVLEEGKCYRMGTAVAGLSLFEGSVLTFNVGDCRVYRFRRRLERLTRDHTEAYELYESGYIDEEEIRFHPMRNILTRLYSAVSLKASTFSFEGRNSRKGIPTLSAPTGCGMSFHPWKLKAVSVSI